MKKLLFYCQHVLGMGHLMRSKALVEGLLEEFSVCFLNGGELIPGFEFPPAVEVVNLPPLKSDANFMGIQAVNGQNLHEIKAARTALLLETYERIQPDLLVLELFPFGRKKFGFELMPLLARIRMDKDKTAPDVVCSVRDIMVSRRDQERHEDRVCRILNRYFDQVLIHADPQFQRLDESFDMINEITVPITYTGYVAQRAQIDADADDLLSLPADEPLILASIGGGRVGSELLAATVEASTQLVQTLPHQLLIFAGPYIADKEFAELEKAVADHAHMTLRLYTNRFLHYMAQADLSISMAGYNTCMNILATGTRSLMLPFRGGDNDEQQIRAQKLADLGIVGVLQSADLAPARLAEIMEERLNASPSAATLNLNGVDTTVAQLQKLTEKSRPIGAATGAKMQSVPYQKGSLLLRSVDQGVGADVIEEQLRPFLTQRAEENAPCDNLHIFLRDDDIDVDEETLRQLLDISLARDVPINLQVIPAGLTEAGYRLVADHKRFTPHLVELNQHGWQHVNHQIEGRKCEFGPIRSYDQQYEDIARGKALLEERFDDLFAPVFTPPWNRCTEETFAVLHELGFSTFSGLRNGSPISGYGFRDISVTLDYYRWKGNPRMKAPTELVTSLIDQIKVGEPIGLMLHHKVMDADAFSFLDALLIELRRYPFIHFHTFTSLARESIYEQVVHELVMQ